MQNNHYVVLLLGLCMVTAWLMLRLLKRNRRKADQPILNVQERTAQARQARGIKGDLEQLMVEVEQLAKRFSAQLDAKTLEMEQLLDRADQTLDHLRGQTLQDHSTESPTSSKPATANIHGYGDQKSRTDDHLSHTIYQLQDEGLDADQIARRTNEHIGKVELILALRHN